jgi:hypothetical protein
LWADWRKYQNRFPGLVRAVGKFLRKEKMTVMSRMIQHVDRAAILRVDEFVVDE